MATAVSICSNALLRLGADPINSFDEADQTGSNIERARLAANLWPTVRKAVLRSHNWNCITTRVLLSPDTTPPAFGFAYRFAFPADWLKTIQVGKAEYEKIQYRTEGRFFVSDEPTFYLVYLRDPGDGDIGSVDAMLVNALESAMQVALCYPVTKSTSLRDTLAKELNAVLSQARTADGQDEPPDTLGDFLLFGAGFGNGLR